MHASELSAEARAVIARYARGECTSSAAAWQLWHDKLTPAEPDPRAADVIVWSKQLGFGIPQTPEHIVEEQVRHALKLMSRT